MIVCLGWGSLIWEQKDLETKSEWREDGPKLPIEFTRQSNDGRLTLVIEPSAKDVQSLWAVMATESLDVAIENLRKREGTLQKYIGYWKQNDNDPALIKGLSAWANLIGASAVIWTALPSKFDNKNDIAPTIEQAMDYLKSLDEEAFKLAKNYIQNAPAQIQTNYRKSFNQAFGW